MNINRNNYEEFFLLYLDRELSPLENREVEAFLVQHADLQKEFAAIQQAILLPADISFDQKNLLYKKEEKRRVVPFYKWRMAAAVALIVAGSLAVFLTKHQNATVSSLSQTTIQQADIKTKIISGKRVKNVKELTEKNTVVLPVVSGQVAEEKFNNTRQRSDKVKSDPVQNNLSVEDKSENPLHQDEALIAEMKPGSTGLQTTEIQNGRTLSVLPEIKAVDLTIASNAIPAETVQQKIQNQSDAYPQSDNAISVVALNDNNKSITGFFKKLTKRTAPDPGNRKVRVSVFQFSY